MFRFDLRTLLGVVLVSSLCLTIGITIGWIEAVGLAGSAVCVWGAIRLRRRCWGRWAGAALTVVGALVAWGVSVDYCTFWVGCPICRLHWWNGEYRLLHRPVHITKSRIHSQRTSLILEDLGAPCDHEMQHEVINRWWGIWFHVHPGIGVTCCLADPEYTDATREKMREAGRQDPMLGTEMRRLLQSGTYTDLAVFYNFVRSVEWGEPADGVAEEVPAADRPEALQSGYCL